MISASDPDGNPLSYSATGLPSGLSIDGLSGLISGTLPFTSAGIYDAGITVTDGAASDTASFTWTVTDVNRSPSLSNPGNQNDNEGSSIDLNLVATDPDGDTLVFGATGLPAGLTINASSGQISGVLSTEGVYSVTATVSDGQGGLDSEVFSWTVSAGVVVDARFDAGAEGFVYQDDSFRGTTHPAYAAGTWSSTAGFSGGGLQVVLGGVDDADILGMAGGWRYDFTLASPARVDLSFRYILTLEPDYESDEFSQALVSVDGVLLGQDGPDYLSQITGDGNGGSAQTAGWQFFTADLGTLSSGSHTVIIGGYNNKKDLQQRI